MSVIDLPLVPQQDHGKTKNHPQNGAADVVHDGVFFEGKVIAGETRRENNDLPVADGTGSSPPSHQGWHRAKRLKVK